MNRALRLLAESSLDLTLASESKTPEAFRAFAAEAALLALEAIGLTERELATVQAFVDRRRDRSYDHAVIASERVTTSMFDHNRDTREIGR